VHKNQQYSSMLMQHRNKFDSEIPQTIKIWTTRLLWVFSNKVINNSMQ